LVWSSIGTLICMMSEFKAFLTGQYGNGGVR
jgi:hypothetical protein